MARVLLAKARFLNEQGMGCVPPLGIMYIASVLREAGHTVRIYDCGEQWDPATLREGLRAFRPDVVGLSAITMESRVMEAMAVLVRHECREVPIVVGGPHATAYPDRCARHPAIDWVVIGEGEMTALELVNALTRGGKDPKTVPGVAWFDAEGVSFAPARASIEDVDAIPFPSWDLVDLELHARSRAMSSVGSRRHMLLFTSRGCPFKCIYCHEVQGKRFRARSPENVVREMQELDRRHGIRDFEVIDDIFNFDRDRMIAILDRIHASGLRPALHFPNALRTDLLDQGQILALRRAGTFFLCVAVETASPRLQKLTKKHLRLDRVRENIDIAVRHGMYVRGFFMLGFPTETLEEAQATVRFALESALHEALFFIVTPFAGTALYEMYRDLLERRGTPIEDFEQMGYHSGRFNLSEIPDEVLFDLQRSAFRRFFLDPRRIARIAARHASKRALAFYGLYTLFKMLPHPASLAAKARRWSFSRAEPPTTTHPGVPSLGWDASEPLRRMPPRKRAGAPVRLPLVER